MMMVMVAVPRGHLAATGSIEGHPALRQRASHDVIAEAHGHVFGDNPPELRGVVIPPRVKVSGGGNTRALHDPLGVVDHQVPDGAILERPALDPLLVGVSKMA